MVTESREHPRRSTRVSPGHLLRGGIVGVLASAGLGVWAMITRASWGLLTIGMLCGFSLFVLLIAIPEHLPAERNITRWWRHLSTAIIVASVLMAFLLLGVEAGAGIVGAIAIATLAAGWRPEPLVPKEDHELPTLLVDGRRVLVVACLTVGVAMGFDFLSRPVPPAVPSDWREYASSAGEWSFRYPPSWRVQESATFVGHSVLLTDATADIPHLDTEGWDILGAPDPDIVAVSFEKVREQFEFLSNLLGTAPPEAGFPLSLEQTYRHTEPENTAQPQRSVELWTSHRDDVYLVRIWWKATLDGRDRRTLDTILGSATLEGASA